MKFIIAKLKVYCWIATILIGIALMMIFRKDSSKLLELLKLKQKEHDEIIEELEKNHGNEKEKANELEEIFKNEWHLLQTEYALRRESLLADHEEHLREIIKENINNPEEMKKRIEQDFEFKYVD